MGEVRDRMKFLIGRTADRLLPSLGREIDEVRNTDRATLLKRAILYSRLRSACKAGDTNAADSSIERSLSAFWKGNSGDQFHEQYAQARIELFLEQHADVIEALAAQIVTSGATFTRIVEIGCGDGKVLSYCLSRLPQIPEAIGLDINASVIKRAAEEYASTPGLHFQVASATDWLSANPSVGSVILSNGGVLEYFSPHSFDAVLRSLSEHLPAAVVLVEPVDRAHDLNIETESHVFGHETSFSHNHRFRLENAGFAVTYAKEIVHGKVRWMTMVATKGV